MVNVDVIDIRKEYGETLAVEGVDFSISSGELITLIGPSGCGKSTLLMMLAGFEIPTSGEVLVGGTPVQGPSPARGVCFQEAALLPWLSVRENVLFGPQACGTADKQIQHRAEILINEFGLVDFINHRPAQLSGGMRQRVAIARVLINEPELLLMDEPFGALDAQTRLEMQEFLMAIHQEFKSTVLFVTHDVDEALLISDRVLVMGRRPGRIIAEIAVNHPRPRGTDFLVSAEFNDLKAQALRLLFSSDGRSSDMEKQD